MTLKDLQIGDIITIYIPGEIAEEKVTILHIPQIQGQLWILKRTMLNPEGREWLIGIQTYSPIVRCN